MIDQKKLILSFVKNDINFFTGVPDSYLNAFCNYLLEATSVTKNVIAANEGNAIGIASGYFLATNLIPVVYMQNSGLGNALNPLLSLVDENVYSIPMILIIGWRGEPGTDDWPQHKKQGEVTTKILDLLEIPYSILPNNDDFIEKSIDNAVKIVRELNKPYAFIVRKGVLDGDKVSNLDQDSPLSRSDAISIVLDTMPKDTIYVATTGRATRELYFLREKRNEDHKNDFLSVGSMGHASSISLGLALGNIKRKIVCLDGDSALIMHMGALTMAIKEKVPNLLHIVLNNGSHESVGGQPSAGKLVDFTTIAKASGYNTVDNFVTKKEEIIEAIQILFKVKKTSFLDIHIHKGITGKLPQLDINHNVLKKKLMNEIKGETIYE